MLILSFARTTAALLANRKRVTRREWSERTFAMWHIRAGQDFQCWSKSPRCGGRKVAIARLVSVDWEATCRIPDSDWEAEGFAYMEEHGINLENELDVARLWAMWRADEDLVTAVIRFDDVRPLEGITPEMFWPGVKSE